jgi:hypothetical protein
MFMDFRDQTPPPRWEPPAAPKPRLTRRQEKTLGWLVGLNLILLLVAPIAGASIITALLDLLT